MPDQLNTLLNKLDEVAAQILGWQSTQTMPDEKLAKQLAQEIRSLREAWFQTLPAAGGTAFGGAQARVLDEDQKAINKYYDAVESVLSSAVFSHMTSGAMKENYDEALANFTKPNATKKKMGI